MNLSELLDHRITVEDAQGGHRYYGWIDQASQRMLVVQGGATGPEAGTRLSCKVAYQQGTASFEAVCTHCLGNDFAMELVGELTVQCLHEDPRFRLDVDAEMHVSGSRQPVKVTDVSLNGVGVISYVKLEAGTSVELHFSEIGRIAVTGKVRHSTPREDGFGFRTGVQLDAMERLQRARWRRLLQHGDPILLTIRYDLEPKAA